MKMYKNEEILQRMILFIELFANVKRFMFLNLRQSLWVIKWNKKDENFKHSISVGSVLFQICVI